MKRVTFILDRQQQNQEGACIRDFKAYFDELLRRTDYFHAKEIVRKRFHIFIYVKDYTV